MKYCFWALLFTENLLQGCGAALWTTNGNSDYYQELGSLQILYLNTVVSVGKNPKILVAHPQIFQIKHV